MGARRAARRAALQALYALDLNPEQPPVGLLEQAIAEAGGEADRPYAETLVRGAWERRDEIDERIRGASRRWRLERMDRVDRSVLRLATYELLASADVPAPIVLDEAVELAREFGAEDSPRFVNGILDRIARELRPGETRPRRAP
ncbi:transcription antitermination factor NusB [Deferrisoma palaeochoriense]